MEKIVELRKINKKIVNNCECIGAEVITNKRVMFFYIREHFTYKSNVYAYIIEDELTDIVNSVVKSVEIRREQELFEFGAPELDKYNRQYTFIIHCENVDIYITLFTYYDLSHSQDSEIFFGW